MKVCVVGAGPCGLTTVKQLLDEGHQVTCYDRNDELGGIWYRHAGDDAHAKAFDNLYLTVSMRLMAYSDLPFRGGRKFFTRQQYHDYLLGYADKFGLNEHISSGCEVVDVVRTGRRWTVTYRHDGELASEEFDAVAVCSGPFKTPNAAIAELAGFEGRIVHSAQYRNSSPFEGKRVLIVGLAESGADIIREIGDVASASTLSIRSYTYLLPRVFNETRSTDNGTVRSHHHEMLRRATDYPFPYESFWGSNPIAKAVFLAFSVVLGVATTALGALKMLRDKLTPRWRGAEPKTNPFGEPVKPPKLDLGVEHTDAYFDMIRTWNRRSHPDGSWSQRGIFCKNVSFIPSIVDGVVELNDAGIERAEGSRVYFKDGASAEFDAVVLCTGYEHDFSLGELEVPENNVRNLYRHLIHPEHEGTVAFIGLTRPFSGGIPICAEMQARYFARLLNGHVQLPKKLDAVIDEERQWEEYWTALSPRATEALPSQVIYLDALAREIGCMIPMRKMLLSPKLFIQLWFGSFNQSSYRVVGPHNLGDAALEDLYSEEVDNRREMAFRMSMLQLLPSSVHPKHMM
ncbi:MAG: NAD(P)-binding domain-containing protein [Gordonia sp. (in: high G+C Gram-positive bacteria)]